MGTIEIVAILSLVVSTVLAILTYKRWREDRRTAEKSDYEAHTMAHAKEDSLAVQTILEVLGAARAENKLLRERNAQLEAEVMAHRARLETTQ